MRVVSLLPFCIVIEGQLQLLMTNRLIPLIRRYTDIFYNLIIQIEQRDWYPIVDKLAIVMRWIYLYCMSM